MPRITRESQALTKLAADVWQLLQRYRQEFGHDAVLHLQYTPVPGNARDVRVTSVHATGATKRGQTAPPL